MARRERVNMGEIAAMFDTVTVLPVVDADTVTAHLDRKHHFPVDTLEDASIDEHLAWHTAEHKTRTPAKNAKTRHSGYLTHTHSEVG